MQYLTKEQAIDALNHGARLSHTYFSKDEWVEKLDELHYIFEDSAEISIEDFWITRRTPFENGWFIVGLLGKPIVPFLTKEQAIKALKQGAHIAHPYLADSILLDSGTIYFFKGGLVDINLLNDSYYPKDGWYVVETPEEVLTWQRLAQVKPVTLWGMAIKYVLDNPTPENKKALIEQLKGQYNDNAHLLTQILGFNLEHPEL